MIQRCIRRFLMHLWERVNNIAAKSGEGNLKSDQDRMHGFWDG